MNKVYTLVFQQNIAPLDVWPYAFDILIPNHTLKIKSLRFDVTILEQLTGIVLPVETQTTQEIILQVGAGVDGSLANLSENLVGGAAVVLNGSTIFLNKPSQLIFDAFYVNNFLNIAYQGTNHDLLIAYRHNVNFILEGEIIDKIK